MRIGVTVYGLLTAAIQDPSGRIELTLPEATDVEGVIEILGKRSSLFDARACIAVVDGVQVPLIRALTDGEELRLYPVFGGG
jgi:molybdopterin converting factor small subunit